MALNDNCYIHPARHWVGRCADRVVNSRRLASGRRWLLSRLPFLQLESDVANVVYLNWVVPAAQVSHLVPAGMRLLERDGMTIVTELTYNHGHFGPVLAGPLRSLFPSPAQSNWRLYVSHLPDGTSAQQTVLFIRNIFDSPLHALATRLFSDALPSHCAASFTHQVDGALYATAIAGGDGSAPSLHASVMLCNLAELPEDFQPFFPSWQAAVETLTLQHAAWSAIPGSSALACAGIDLPIQLADVRPAQSVEVSTGDFLRALGIRCVPFSFVVPQVKFRVRWEKVWQDGAILKAP